MKVSSPWPVHSGCSAETAPPPPTPRPPATTVLSTTVPSGVSLPTCKAAASQGMSGWFHDNQANRAPDTAGYATKSDPPTTTVSAEGFSAAEPSSGTITMSRTGAAPATWVSRTA